MDKKAIGAAVVTMFAVIGVAVAQDAGAAPAAVLGTWAQIFTGLDIVTMICIGILAFWMARSFGLSEQRAILIPTSLGLLYGLVDAWAKYDAGWTMAQATLIAFKGVLFNGAGATMVGRVTALAVERWWPSPAGEVKAEIKRIVDEQQPSPSPKV